jgi:hypothetical protein
MQQPEVKSEATHWSTIRKSTWGLRVASGTARAAAEKSRETAAWRSIFLIRVAHAARAGRPSHPAGNQSFNYAPVVTIERRD